jgi:replicative DNA helicase
LSKLKYIDTPATVQVLGCIINDLSILDDSRYDLSDIDFPKGFHRTLFSALTNLAALGTEYITPQTLEDYLKDKPQSYAEYKAGDGPRFVKSCMSSADFHNFEYYYNRIKKLTLMQAYYDAGLDVSIIYNPDELDISKREQQNKYFDSLSLTDIADKIDTLMLKIRAEYVDHSIDNSILASAGIDELFASLGEVPDVGQPMYGEMINTITRGMRLGKFYLRSAATGVGKTRTMIADFCNCGCAKIWKNGEWIDNGLAFPSFFISTELELDELQTMMVAFLADINEENILNNVLSFEERERVKTAIQIIKDSPLYIEVIPNFSLKDIENAIKRNIRMYSVQYIFLDYIHTSMKILEEITKRSGGVRLREDNILFLLSVTLKEIATEYNVFILSSTQLNQDWKSAYIPDQNLLRGAKSIADKVDTGMLLLDITDEDKEKLQTIVNDGMGMPNVKMSIYKNRRGSYNKCYLWMYADKSTCRFDGAFCTDYNYELIPITDTRIHMRV